MPAYSRIHKLVRRRLKAADGFTLVEMLISMSIFLTIIAAVMAALVVSQHTQIRDANYGTAQQQAQSGLNSMVSQIRQATSIISTSPNSVELDVNLNGTSYHVLYECDVPQTGTTYNECVRVQALVGATLPSLSTGAVVVGNLINGTITSPVFSFAPDPIAPYYMTATIQVPASNAQTIGLNHAISFSDGALMRNLTVGN
ncbi:MAG: PilW family protein [Solirubrobacteraceae bacterium]